MDKKHLTFMKIFSLGFYILLCLNMFSNIQNRMMNKLQIVDSHGFLIVGIGLGVSILIYMIRLRKENDIKDIYQGCIIYAFFIIINLMDAHILSSVYYFLIRITFGYIYQFLKYAIYIWTASLVLEIGVGILLVLILTAAYIAIMYFVLNPNPPLLILLIIALTLIGGVLGGTVAGVAECGKQRKEQKEYYNDSGNVLGELYDAYLEDRKRDDIKRAADELEKIRFDMSRK